MGLFLHRRDEHNAQRGTAIYTRTPDPQKAESARVEKSVPKPCDIK